MSSVPPPLSDTDQPQTEVPGTPVMTEPPVGTAYSLKDDRQMAMINWTLALFVPLVGPLVFYLALSEGKPVTKRQSALALTMGIIHVVAAATIFIGIGVILAPLASVCNIALGIMGAVAMNGTDDFNPPLITDWCKSLFKI